MSSLLQRGQDYSFTLPIFPEMLERAKQIERAEWRYFVAAFQANGRAAANFFKGATVHDAAVQLVSTVSDRFKRICAVRFPDQLVETAAEVFGSYSNEIETVMIHGNPTSPSLMQAKIITLS